MIAANPASLINAFRNPRRSRQAIRELQNRKLRALVTAACDNTDYYRDLFKQEGLKPADINSIEDLSRIPPLSKQTLQSLGPDAFLDRRFDRRRLKVEKSSGSSGRPTEIWMDKSYLWHRNLRFLRGLYATGYRPGKRLFLVTSSAYQRQKPWLGWRYGSITAAAADLLQQINDFQPHIVYGCTTPLRLAAEYAIQHSIAVHSPHAVISTAEMLEPACRTLLSETFAADVYDFYGMTEMGLVGWECDRHDGYHIAEDAILIEAAPANSATATMLMTNLELNAMPLLRFESGDIAQLDRDHNCSCRNGFSKLSRIEGRVIDAITLADGRCLSPYEITCRIEQIAGIRRFQLLQETANHYRISVVSAADTTGSLEPAIHETLRSVLGSDAQVSVEFVADITHDPARKFRVVESKL